MGNLMGKQHLSPSVGQTASRISHLPPKGGVGNIEGSPGNSRFPMNSLFVGKRERENGKSQVESGVAMKCLETRQRNGMKWRRYRTAEGVIVTTYEVPCEVVRCLGQARVQAELERAARQRERASRNARALALLADGWKPLAVGDEVGLCESQVRRLRQKAQSTRSRSRVSAEVAP